MEPARSLYVHAPFCARRCFYCDFAVEVRREGDGKAWASALGRELALRERRHPGILASELETVFVGGGTPSLLGPDAMSALKDAVGPHRFQHAELEWTSEANPESLTREVAQGWREAGLNRLSLGVQSFQEPVLRWMGRLHGAQGAVEAVETARQAGIANLSVDLIFGLPPTLERSWKEDLERALELEVPHVSLYGLTAEKGTPLGRGVAEGRVTMTTDDRYAEEYLLTNEILTQAGYEHYEVSNFARPGFSSRHNQRYWDGSGYLGLGNSSHSFQNGRRWWNVRSWPDYLQRVEAGEDPTDTWEEVRGEAAHLERCWLGLRRAHGVPASWVEKGAAQERLQAWTSRGLAEVSEGRLKLTPQGWLLLDELAVELSEVVDPPPAG